MIDLDLGAGKIRVGDNSKLTYLFPEVYHGCNEMEAGTWKLDAKGLHLHISMEYDEAFAVLKSGSKPQQFNIVVTEFEKVFSGAKE